MLIMSELSWLVKNTLYDLKDFYDVTVGLSKYVYRVAQNYDVTSLPHICLQLRFSCSSSTGSNMRRILKVEFYDAFDVASNFVQLST